MAVVLDEVEVKDVVTSERRLVYVDTDASLDQALQVLKEQNILAVPVRQLEPPRPSEDGTPGHPELKFCGMLSVLDVAAFLARDPKSRGDRGEAEAMTAVTVKQAMRKTAESWHMLLLDPHATVARAMEYLGVRGFHRALVPNVCLCEHAPDQVPLPSALVEEIAPSLRGEQYQVLSQMDLARFVAKHEGRFGLALAQSIESVGLEGGKVLGTTRDEKLSDALDRMAGHAVSLHPASLCSWTMVSALAVVDRLEKGAPWAPGDALLLDTLSASDLRGCTVQDLKQARETTVGAFLDKARGPGARKLLTCRRSSDLRGVLNQMLEQSVHRIWVTADPDPSKPEEPLPLVSVVSLSDLIRVMRILPVTNTPENGQDIVDLAIDNFMWMEWNF